MKYKMMDQTLLKEFCLSEDPEDGRYAVFVCRQGSGWKTTSDFVLTLLVDDDSTEVGESISTVGLHFAYLNELRDCLKNATDERFFTNRQKTYELPPENVVGRIPGANGYYIEIGPICYSSWTLLVALRCNEENGEESRLDIPARFIPQIIEILEKKLA